MSHMNSEGPEERAHLLQSDLDIFCLSTYTTVSIDFVSGQRRPRSAGPALPANYIRVLFVRGSSRNVSNTTVCQRTYIQDSLCYTSV